MCQNLYKKFLHQWLYIYKKFVDLDFEHVSMHEHASGKHGHARVAQVC